MADQEALKTMLPNMHAVVIGIDSYLNVAQLRGAVQDAKSVVSYLCSDLAVPEAQVTCLKNEEATRSNIITAINQLRNNPSIKPFDPILIYFAGHGCEQASPLFNLEKCTYSTKTQCLVPWDVGCKQEQALISAIPDYTLAALLYGIAKAKGNNITVILDACHSSSSTRGLRPSYYMDYNNRFMGTDDDTPAPSLDHTDSTSHQARLLTSHEVPPIALESDADILQSCLPGDLSLTDQVAPGKPGGITPNFSPLSRSHVLLAACDHSEVAHESLSTSTGCFTTALLKQLRSTSLNRLTYRMCFNTFPLMNTPVQQSPVCEGDIDRFFFSSRVMVNHHQIIPMHNFGDNTGSWYLGAGAAQGVIHNAKFSVYAYDTSTDTDETSDQVPTTTFAISQTLKDPCRSTFLLSTSIPTSRFMFAKLVERGDGHTFGVYLTEAARSTLDMDIIFQPQHGIIRVDTREKAQVVLDVDNQKHITFELVQFGLPSRRILPARASPDPNLMQQILFSMAQWDWHVSRYPREFEIGKNLKNRKIRRSRKRLVNLVMHRLEESGPRRIFSEDEDREEVMLPRNDDLYGFEVTSRCSRGLHVYLFYYSTEQQSIRPLFLPVCGPGTISAPLDPDEKLTIGYGNDDALAGAILFQNKSDVGYFRIFATTSPGDFDSMTQQSPFKKENPGQRHQSVEDDDGFNDGLMVGNFTLPLSAVEPIMGDPLEPRDARKLLGEGDIWDVAEIKVRFETTRSVRQRKI